MPAINSLICLACGDAYGCAFEMEGLRGSKWEIDELPDYARIKKVTDDTKMALILWEHYKTYGVGYQSKLKKAYQKWAREDGEIDGIGIHTASVLLHGKTDKDSQGNGALMRVIPYGLKLIEDGYSFDEAVSYMNQDSAITHKNDVIFYANKICLDIAMNGWKKAEQDTQHKRFIESCKHGYTAWVKHSLFAVFQALKHTDSLLDGYKFIVSMGGDTDTNCAIYGAIVGFRQDIDKLALENYIATHYTNIYKLLG